MASPLWMKSWRISFIIIWNITGELHSLKNMTVGSNSPRLVRNTAFHSSPSLICCRRDISLVSNVPIGTGFGPQNITVITSQESHHQHAFFDQNCRNHFPHALETET